MVADKTTLIDYDWITFSDELHAKFAADSRADERIIECVVGLGLGLGLRLGSARTLTLTLTPTLTLTLPRDARAPGRGAAAGFAGSCSR